MNLYTHFSLGKMLALLTLSSSRPPLPPPNSLMGLIETLTDDSFPHNFLECDMIFIQEIECE